MKNYLISYLLVLFLCLGFIGISEGYLYALDGEAPDFKLQDIDGQWVDLASYKGKSAVLLLFWTTWCPYCRFELKALNEKYDSFKDDLELLSINIKEPKNKVKDFLKKNGLNSFRVLLDSEASVAYNYELLGVPTYILINEKGKIVFRGYRFPHNYKEFILK